MSLAFLLKNTIATLVLPPGNGLALLALAGLFRRRRWAFGVAVLAGTLLYAQSTPLVVHFLIAPLEQRAGPAVSNPDGAGAIVVLSSGLDFKAPEYGGDTAHERTLLRTRYGATLARRYALPVLVTGGQLGEARRSEAEVMAEILEREFGVAVRWQETKSEDTHENAEFSARILREAGVSRILLVTQAFHMPRARLLFEKAGLEVIPAPTGFKSGPEFSLSFNDLWPQASALQTSYYALHEWLGLLWTNLRH
jgi:uncharacterized SAM-binding protein YcdF (DUF218 family)